MASIDQSFGFCRLGWLFLLTTNVLVTWCHSLFSFSGSCCLIFSAFSSRTTLATCLSLTNTLLAQTLCTYYKVTAPATLAQPLLGTSLLQNTLKCAWRLCNSMNCELKVILFYEVDTWAWQWLSPVDFGTISTEFDTFPDLCCHLWWLLDTTILIFWDCFHSDHLDRPWHLGLTTVCSSLHP